MMENDLQIFTKMKQNENYAREIQRIHYCKWWEIHIFATNNKLTTIFLQLYARNLCWIH